MRVVEEFGVVPDEPAAFSDGDPLVSEDGMPRTLSEALLRTSANEPAKGIVHVQSNGAEVFQSYPTLLQDARRLLSGLYSEGLVAKDRAILQIESLQDFSPPSGRASWEGSRRSASRLLPRTTWKTASS